MVRIVIDCSVSARWILADEKSKASETLLRRILERQVQLIVPVLWIYEMANVLRSAVISKRIEPSLAFQALETIRKIPYERVSLEDAGVFGCLKGAIDSNLSVYDASYYYLAESKGLPLITLDKDLLKLRKHASFIKSLDDFLELF